MERNEKEKLLYDLKVREIDSFQKNNSVFQYKFAAGLGVLFIFALTRILTQQENLAKNEVLYWSVFLLLITLLFLWINSQEIKFIDDEYIGLSEKIKKGKLTSMDFERTTLRDGLYYRRKY